MLKYRPSSLSENCDFAAVSAFFASEIRHSKWASSRENLSSGFATRVDLNRPAQLQRLAGFIKLHINKLEILYYLGSEQQRRWSDCADAQADLRLCCSHMTKTGFLMTRLKNSMNKMHQLQLNCGGKRPELPLKFHHIGGQIWTGNWITVPVVFWTTLLQCFKQMSYSQKRNSVFCFSWKVAKMQFLDFRILATI